jgi:PAS domain S-box-containing protein
MVDRQGSGERRRRRVARQRGARALFDALPAGVLLLDREGIILCSNPTAQDLLGRPAAQLHGRSCFDRAFIPVAPDGRPLPADQRPLVQALRSGVPLGDAVVSVSRPDGTRVWLLERAHLRRDAAGTAGIGGEPSWATG